MILSFQKVKSLPGQQGNNLSLSAVLNGNRSNFVEITFRCFYLSRQMILKTRKSLFVAQMLLNQPALGVGWTHLKQLLVKKMVLQSVHTVHFGIQLQYFLPKVSHHFTEIMKVKVSYTERNLIKRLLFCKH